MQRFGFKKGLAFREGSRLLTLMRRLATGKLQFEDESGEIISLTDTEVLMRWHNRSWILDESSLSLHGSVIYLATARDISTYPEKLQEKARRRLRYLQKIDPAHTPYNVETWKMLIAQVAKEINDPSPPGPSTVATWWKRYRITKSINTLIPSARQKDPSRNPKYAVFEDVIQKVYLNNQRKPISVVVDEINAEVHRLNQVLVPDEQMKPPSRATIYRWAMLLHQDLVEASRLGASAYRMKYRTAMGGLKVAGILERIEIDHTPIDLLVVDKETQLPLGRPWLTLAIDKHSRMIMGFYFSFNAPSAHSVLQCLRMSIMPKDSLVARFPSIKGQWLASGLPDLIAADNGMDLHADAVQLACDELGVVLQYCPAGDPYTKASIERVFRTINQDLFHQLPGTVFSNTKERGDYPSETEAAIDLNTLSEIFTTWIVDVYQNSLHRGIGTSPLLKWMEGVEMRDFNWPVDPDSIEVIIGIPASRTVFHYGIELECLHYNSPQLQQLRRIAGNNLRVDLKFYEDTIDHIHVFDPNNNEYIRVDAVDVGYANALPRHTHQLIREHARKQYGDQYSTSHLLEAKETIKNLISQALQDKKMVIRKAAAKAARHDSQGVFDNSDPLAKARNPKRTAISKPPEPLPDGLSDALPDIASMGLPSLDLSAEDKPKDRKP